MTVRILDILFATLLVVVKVVWSIATVVPLMVSVVAGTKVCQ